VCESKTLQLRTLLALSYTYLFCQQSVGTVLQETFVPATEQKKETILIIASLTVRDSLLVREEPVDVQEKTVIYCKNRTEI